MAELELKWDTELGLADVVPEGGDLRLDNGLQTLVIVSLFTDRRARDDDPLPYADNDPRGWWGDQFLGVEGDQIGSRLWLLSRERLNSTTLVRAEEYIKEALQWMVDDGIVLSVSVTVERTGLSSAYAEVELTRPERDPVRFRFNALWEGQANAIQ